MDYTKLKKPELTELCKKRGLDPNGKVNDLIKRLIDTDKNASILPMEFETTEEIRTDSKKALLDENAHVQESGSRIYEGKIDINTFYDNKLPVTNFYLHLKSSNLSNYFNCGYFYPLALEESVIYRNENRSKDILSQFPYYIILLKGAINRIENDDVIVELNTNGLELTNSENNDFTYTNNSIPVSRVASIQFASKELKNTFIASTSAFPDTFIPNGLCGVVGNKNIPVLQINFENIKLPYNQDFFTWKKKLDLFDKILGMFAFMKNAGVFSLTYENQLAEYTNGFLGALYKLNNAPELSIFKENPLLTYIITSDKIELNSAYRVVFKQIINRILKNEVFDFNVALSILETAINSEHASDQEKIDLKTIDLLFRDLKSLKISHKNLLGNELIRKKHPSLLALALLVKFSNKSRQNTDKQAVRTLFIDNELQFRQTEIEFLLAILGFYYGYKSMIKTDTNIRLKDKNIDFFVNQFQSIKFSGGTYWEKFIIETIFQYSLALKPTIDNYTFLREKAEKSVLIIPSINNSSTDYINESYQIFDKTIYRYIRNSQGQKALEMINNKYESIISGNSYLIHFLVKNLRWNKNMVLDLINKNMDEASLDELIKAIELDSFKKFK